MLVRTPTGQKRLLNGLRVPKRALALLGTIEAGARQRNRPPKATKMAAGVAQGSEGPAAGASIPWGFDFGRPEAHTAPLPQIGSTRSPLLQPNGYGQHSFVSGEARRRGI